MMTPTEPVDQLFRRVIQADGGDYDPWLYRYCGKLASTEEAARYRRHLADLLKFAQVDPRGATVLDAGCGFGFTLVALRSLGAAQAFGVDVSEPMIRPRFRSYLPLLPDEVSNGIHVAEPVSRRCRMPIARSTSSCPSRRSRTTATSARSSVRPPGSFAPAGRYSSATTTTVATRGFGERRTPCGRSSRPESPASLEAGTSGTVRTRLRREEIIRATFPRLSDDVVADLVLRTAFMSRDQIIAAVRNYEDGGALPSSFFDGSDAPVDPELGRSPRAAVRSVPARRADDALRVHGSGSRGTGPGRAAIPSSDWPTESSAVCRVKPSSRRRPSGSPRGFCEDRCRAL